MKEESMKRTGKLEQIFQNCLLAFQNVTENCLLAFQNDLEVPPYACCFEKNMGQV